MRTKAGEGSPPPTHHCLVFWGPSLRAPPFKDWLKIVDLDDVMERRAIKSQANAFTSTYEIALRCHVGSCKCCPKSSFCGRSKGEKKCTDTHMRALGSASSPHWFGRPQQAITTTAWPGLLVVGPLFQQSGFSLPLDRDQVRLHNTPLCLESEEAKERASCRHVSLYVHTNV